MTLMGIVAAVAAVLVVVTAPESPGAAWKIAVAGGFLALAAATRSLSRALDRGSAAAGLWLEGAGVPVAGLWALGAVVQGVTAEAWPWRWALVAQVLGAAVWAVVAVVTGAVAARAAREASERAVAQERHGRLKEAAAAVLAGGETSGVRVDLATRVLASRPGELGDALVEEEIEAALRASHGGRR